MPECWVPSFFGGHHQHGDTPKTSRGQSHLSNRRWAQTLRPVRTLPALFIIRMWDSFAEKVEIHWTDECQVSGKGTEWFQRWSVISGSDGDVLAARTAPASLCSNAPKEVPICWLEIHSRGRLMMQCKQACWFLCSRISQASLHLYMAPYVITWYLEIKFSHSSLKTCSHLRERKNKGEGDLTINNTQ